MLHFCLVYTPCTALRPKPSGRHSNRALSSEAGFVQRLSFKEMRTLPRTKIKILGSNGVRVLGLRVTVVTDMQRYAKNGELRKASSWCPPGLAPVAGFSDADDVIT